MVVYLITQAALSWCLYFSLTLFLGGGDNVVFGEPTIESPDFQLDKIVDGLSRPTGLTFLVPGDFIVIEEDTGMVKRITNAEISQTILDLDVSTNDSRGLIGIDSFHNGSKTPIV
jgi:hypothetical protein